MIAAFVESYGYIAVFVGTLLEGETILIAAEKAFWRAVKTGETPAQFDCEPPKPRIEAVRVVDMNASNSWAEFAGLFRDTQGAHTDHERAKAELKISAIKAS